MSDLKLFRLSKGRACELEGRAAALEKSLQELMERNLESLLGIRFLSSEHSTGPKHGGRIDTLGLDENGTPVILEYKRARNENVINQGLFYLDWLMDHKADFKLLVMERLGQEAADGVDLVEGFTRDVRSIGHYGTGDLEVTLRTSADLQRAHDLFVRSYEAS